ncbi:MarR family winged helix-turn-helix transcriptional regulator [Rhodovibrionaceae bacterium A322]
MTAAAKTKTAPKKRPVEEVTASPTEAGAPLYREIIRIVERMHRRLLDVVRVELMRLGVEDVSSAQMVMLLNIQGNEVSVRDLIERGYYLGSNASYNLKQLLEAGYITRSASQRDKRAARISLSEKGAELCDELRKVEEIHAGLIVRNEEDVAELEVTFRNLRRLEMTWTDVIRYGDGHNF